MVAGPRAEARCAPGAWTALTLALLHHLQEQAQSSALERGVAVQELAQPRPFSPRRLFRLSA